ncbi:MAG: hypothetical protein AAF126_07720, partial [Chloroflexota bacterium]
GTIHDRDLNAALNIRDYPASHFAKTYETTTGGSPESYAGGGGLAHRLSDGVCVPPVKPEATTFRWYVVHRIVPLKIDRIGFPCH